MGFHPKWIEWISGCIRNPMFSVLLMEDQEAAYLQQELFAKVMDALSPFLFIIIIE